MALYRDHAHRSEDDSLDRLGYIFSAWKCRKCGAQYLAALIGDGLAIFYAIDSNAVYSAPYTSGAPWIANACTCGDGLHLTWRYAVVTGDLNAIGLPQPPDNLRLN